MELKDNYDRAFPYLRLSITDVCNFRCEYCLPDGYHCDSKPKFLDQDEIRRLVTAFAELGVWKIRLTGGEPSVRKDFTEITKLVSGIDGIDAMAFTTNGYRLKQNATTWYEAGMRRINVSIDSLNPEKFHEITGHNRLPEILDGVEKSLEIGYDSVKINVVLLKGLNDQELPDYLAYVKDRPITVRFIELMQTGDNLAYFKQRHLSADVIRQQLLAQGWVENIRENGAGPAVNFTHPDYQGAIGLIAPYSKDFCTNCNRLRVTATGDLRLCLFGDVGVPLRDLLARDDQKEALQMRIMKQLNYKKSSHFLADGNTGILPNLSATGG
ncbi:GTP 3',8-cyclase MoaA [Paremcibacter congregatus]|uniref:GTP 3',8-cyclase MoaA n=1 Tax=Paremcibacter congregatus TaxID=2043170 RepID=UPI0030EF9AF1